MSISKKKLSGVLNFSFINTIFILIIYYSSLNYTFENWVVSSAGLILLKLLVTLVYFRKNNINFFSFTNFFIVLLYLFHYGQMLVSGIFKRKDFSTVTNWIFMTPQALVYNGIIFSLIITFFIEIGIILSVSKKQKVDRKESKLVSNKVYKIVGWFFIIISFPIELSTTLQQIRVSLQSGYLASINEVGVPGIVGLIGSLFYIGTIMLILVYLKEQRKVISSIIAIFLAVFLVLDMFSGGRHLSVMYLLLLVYIYNYKVRKINYKNIIFVIIMGILFLAFLNSVRDFRSLPNKNISDFLILLQYYLIEVNSFISMIEELGGSILTVFLTIEQVPDHIPFALGRTYLQSLSTLLININGTLTDIFNYSHFVRILQFFYSGNLSHVSSLGGSIIAELYFNFSYFSILPAFLIGFTVNKISMNIEYHLINNDIYKFCFYIPIFIYGLIWVRDAFGTLVRPVVYIGILLYLIFNTLQFSIKKNKK